MKAVNVRQLKNNPSEALLVHLDDQKLLREPGVRAALATALFRSESLSLGRAARLAGMALDEFIQHVSRIGVPVVRGSVSSLREDAAGIAAWRKKSSSATPAR